ncbi:hypothetical protein RMCBS344292_02103 [Rhizopus microsporus]|nr:hypothetical protein RMCBS344292_02103 [Rhizopus microsporus]
METIDNKPKNKPFMRTVKFWQRSTTTTSTDNNQSATDDAIDQGSEGKEEALVPRTDSSNSNNSNKSRNSVSFTLSFGRKKSSDKHANNVPLVESTKEEVYKLSIIDDSGIYMPPSPTVECKKDHWIDNEDIMDFHIPSSECLTSHVTEKHDFFTPSSFVECQPYIFPIAQMSVSSLSSSSSSIQDDRYLDLTSSSSMTTTDS